MMHNRKENEHYEALTRKQVSQCAFHQQNELKSQFLVIKLVKESKALYFTVRWSLSQ